MNRSKDSQDQGENVTLEEKEVPCNEDNNGKEQDKDFAISKITDNNLEKELLNHLTKSKAIFKSQQKDEPELTLDEKHTIAAKLLEKSHCLFLSKFGHHLKEEHLEYFIKNEDYEMAYHINRLRRYFNNSMRHIDVRNRRYEALKALIEKGEYFSECEMMKRNPLLYEHLVGQYLTEEEKKARDSINTRDANYVDILMETIERDKLREHLKSQQKEEDCVREENDSDDDDNNDSNEDGEDSVTSETDNKQAHYHWGDDLNNTIDNDDKDRDKKLHNKVQHKISKEEIQLFRQEFLTNMYQSFLDGNDSDFDYRYIYL